MQHLQPNTTLQGGKYRIERVLGQGGFGITYLAEQVSLSRKVAIKELFIGGRGQAINDRSGNQVVVTNSANQASFDQQKEKFKKEARRLACLNHPNLVKVHDSFEENGTAYYVMEYIDGVSLRTKLNKEGCLSESLVLKYLQQLLPALDTAHRQSVWHLDIKPENIMVDGNERVYLIDFGASKHIEQNKTLTTSLALAYTRGYCPPELSDLTYESQNDFIRALKEIGPWTDIYALGATMYNLLTDSIPPSSNRLYRDGRNAFMFPSTVSSSTSNLIVKMMKPNREDRPQGVIDISICMNNNATPELKEHSFLPEGEKIHNNVNFILLDKKKSDKVELTVSDTNKDLSLYFDTYNLTINFDMIDAKLLDKLCRKDKKGDKLFAEDISKETKVPIGVILIHLGWLMKEGKVGSNRNVCTKHTKTPINPELAAFAAGDVYDALARKSSSMSLEEIINDVSTEEDTPIDELLLGIGWLMKEGKLHFENNQISLW